MKIPLWVSNLWKSWGSKFQPAYNKIDSWDIPWLRDMLRELWNVLDDEMKKAIFVFIMAVIKKYGEEKAKDVVNSLNKRLKA